MGNAFEQMTWLVYDAVIMILMKKTGKTEEEIKVFLAEEEVKFREEYGANFITVTDDDGNETKTTLGYYAVFTPLSTILGNWLVESCGWNEYLVTVMNMLLNFVTEYLFDTFVVFRGSMDTNEAAKKKAAQ